MLHRTLTLCPVVVILFLLPRADGGLIFNFTDGIELAALQGTNLPQYNNVRNGFQEAADLFSNQFSDDVTLNVEINFKSAGFGATTLGSTLNVTAGASYSGVRTALVNDATTTVDSLATANLQTTAGIDFISRTNNAAARSNLTDAWSQVLDVSRSNLKALGLISGTDGAAGSEGTIQFNSAFGWDFDRSNGISGSLFDFVGVAAHEIGHLMGFTSGVYIVDGYGNSTAPIDELSQYRVFNTLDLFRYSSTSLSESGQPGTGAVLDLNYAGTPYFSLDAGITNLATFSTGAANGDVQQASHWKDNLGLGLLDPTFAPGELGVITSLDITAFDAIGWDAANSAAVTEPSSFALFGMGAIGLIGYRRRKRKQAS